VLLQDLVLLVLPSALKYQVRLADQASVQMEFDFAFVVQKLLAGNRKAFTQRSLDLTGKWRILT